MTNANYSSPTNATTARKRFIKITPSPAVYEALEARAKLAHQPLATYLNHVLEKLLLTNSSLLH